ncbi:hypothetical protein GCM10017744_023900 [Streptomyces antimycoticus]
MVRRRVPARQAGKGPAFVRTKLKNVLSGKVVDKTFNAGVKVETANVDKRGMQFSYKDGESFVFMDMDTFDQIYITPEVVGDNARYLLEGFEAVVAMYEGNPLYVELPAAVELVIEYTERASRATAPPVAPSPPSWRPATRSASRCSSPPVRRSRSTPAPASTSVG